jgi:hypothetical protein
MTVYLPVFRQVTSNAQIGSARPVALLETNDLCQRTLDFATIEFLALVL